MLINRSDMLELTRRMTDTRTHLVRVAGAYMDEEGCVDGTFNTFFQNLHGAEKKRTLEIAKAVPFSKTNEELKAFRAPKMQPGSVWQLLNALIACELQNDALLLNLYEYIGENYPAYGPYAIYIYYGVYDIITKASDNTFLDESTEIYRYLILAMSPLDSGQNPGKPFAGFLYPALTDRSSDPEHVNVYCENGNDYAFEAMKGILRLTL